MRDKAERDSLIGALGAAVAVCRRERGITQQELAFRCGMHPAVISRLERGKSNPQLLTLIKISGSLGMETADLLARAEQIRSLRSTGDDKREPLDRP